MAETSRASSSSSPRTSSSYREIMINACLAHKSRRTARAICDELVRRAAEHVMETGADRWTSPTLTFSDTSNTYIGKEEEADGNRLLVYGYFTGKCIVPLDVAKHIVEIFEAPDLDVVITASPSTDPHVCTCQYMLYGW